MFKPEVYTNRRSSLKKELKEGLALFLGNVDVPMNYPANTYHFRQDSDFLYFFGLNLQNLAGIIDFETGEDIIFGDDYTMDDIIWMGPQPSVANLAATAGVKKTEALGKLESYITTAQAKGRKIHFLPPYRAESKMKLGAILKENPCQMKTMASEALIREVVKLRSIKEDVEIAEIEKAVGIAWEMHTTSMKMCKPGVTEQEIFGTLEGIAFKYGGGPSFPIILSINGQTLHNHAHHNVLKVGRMMVTDCGAETNMSYSSDITRTTPVGGKFSNEQRDIYEIVLKANMVAIEAAKPGVSNRDIHLTACKVIAEGMKELGVMKGNMDDAVREGAHALFMPHGLGHMMGMDVHDMESVGENFVGYNDEVKRSTQFGLAFLRFALPYKPGHVFTVEPGCYFIPELIDKWRAEKMHSSFINYEAADKFRSFGGVRIEDDLLITPTGNRILGKPIPKSVSDIEATCAS